MHGINIVTAYKILDNAVNMLTRFRQSGVEIQLLAVLHKHFRFFEIQVVRCQFFLVVRCHAIRVEPGVHLHSAFVAFLNHEGRRIPERVGSNALFARQETAPRLKVGHKQSIGLRTHLKQHGIHIHRSHCIKHTDNVGLYFIGRHVTPSSVSHSRIPCSAEFTLRIFYRFGSRIFRPHAAGQQQYGHTCQDSFSHY